MENPTEWTTPSRWDACAIDAPFGAAPDSILIDTTIVAIPVVPEHEKGEHKCRTVPELEKGGRRCRIVEEEGEVEGCTSPHSSQTKTREGWVEDVRGGCRSKRLYLIFSPLQPPKRREGWVEEVGG